MSTITTLSVTSRDRAILAAVAAGRCTVRSGAASILLVEGRCCADQFALRRLTSAGWVRALPPDRSPASDAPPGETACLCLTREGAELLAAR